MILVPTLPPFTLMKGADDAKASSVKFFETVADDVRKAWRLTKQKPNWDESCIWERAADGRLVNLFPTADEVYRFIGAIYVSSPTPLVTIDIETSMDSPVACELLCVGVGFTDSNGADRAMCIPFLAQGRRAYWATSYIHTYVWGLLQQLCADPRVRKNFQNGAFDTTALTCHGAPVAGFTADTMLAHHIIDAELPHGLGYLGTRYLDIAYWKDDAKGDEKNFEVSDEVLRAYNLKDILSTHRLLPILEAEVARLGLWQLYQEEVATSIIMARATMRGLAVDPERLEKLASELRLKRDDALLRLRHIAQGAIEPSKPAHLKYLLFDQLKFPVVMRTATGNPSTNKDALVLLALAADTDEQRAALSALVDLRSASKALSTWAENLDILGDGRVHATWKMHTTSGRFASSPNMQNHPKRIQKIFRAAPPGWGVGHPGTEEWVLVGVDLSQAELRFIGYTANDPELLTMYSNGIDVHTVNVALLFNLRCPVGSDNTNAQTEAFLAEAVPRLLGARYDYSTFAVASPKKWKAIRTLAKNFEFGCIERSTPVALLNGEKPICEVQPGDWTWCWDGTKYAPTKIVRAWSTGTQECVRVTMKDGAGKYKTLVLTAGHKMLMRDGTYREAGQLQKRDRLMPFRRWESNGYNQIDPQNNGGREYEHRWVVDGEVVHHANENRKDNRPENLIATTRVDHLREFHEPPVISSEGLRARAEKAKQHYADNRAEVIARLTAARMASPKWKASTEARLEKARVTRRANGWNKRAPKPPCACGAPHHAKGLCRPCYMREYQFKKNHEVVMVEPCGAHEVWDLEVEHAAHNFALANSVFVSNSNYGAIPETLFDVLRAKRDDDGKLLFADIDLALIEALLATKLRLRPALPKWWSEICRETQKRGYYQCPVSGRIRFFRDGFKRNEMLNVPIQMGVASVMNKRLLKLQSIFDHETGGACQVVLQVHDALTFECPKSYAPRCQEVIYAVMHETFALPNHPAARLPCDMPKIGEYVDQV